MTTSYEPQLLLYAETHEWIHVEGNVASIGITDYAQDQLSDVVWVELPDVCETFETGQVIATVESVKAAGDIYTPIAGKVIEVNLELTSAPELINSQPYASWFCRIEFDEGMKMPPLLAHSDYLRLTQDS